MIGCGNVLPQFHCAAFAQACKVNFEEVRFAIAGVIFLRFVIDDRNNLHENFSSRDYYCFNNLPITSVSNQIVLPIRRNVFILV